MKRALWLFLFALIATPAYAGHWVQKEIRWTLSNIGSPYDPTGIYVRDTTYAPNIIKASGTADTTGAFSLNDADVFHEVDWATDIDTIQTFAYFCLAQDSVGASSTLQRLTVEIDGQVAPPGASSPVALGQWNQVDSVLVVSHINPTGGSGFVAPIRVLSGVGMAPDAENGVNYYYRPLGYERLRIRLTAASGVMAGRPRAFIRYWDDDAYNQGH